MPVPAFEEGYPGRRDRIEKRSPSLSACGIRFRSFDDARLEQPERENAPPARRHGGEVIDGRRLTSNERLKDRPERNRERLNPGRGAQGSHLDRRRAKTRVGFEHQSIAMEVLERSGALRSQFSLSLDPGGSAPQGAEAQVVQSPGAARSIWPSSRIVAEADPQGRGPPREGCRRRRRVLRLCHNDPALEQA